MPKYDRDVEKCPYCGSDHQKYIGVMCECRPRPYNRNYEVIAVWECQDCKITYKDMIEW